MPIFTKHRKSTVIPQKSIYPEDDNKKIIARRNYETKNPIKKFRKKSNR